MTPERPVAIVTGGARGIGRASAVALARRGFAVAIVDQREAELQEAGVAVRAAGVDALALVGDVADFARTQN